MICRIALNVKGSVMKEVLNELGTSKKKIEAGGEKGNKAELYPSLEADTTAINIDTEKS